MNATNAASKVLRYTNHRGSAVSTGPGRHADSASLPPPLTTDSKDRRAALLRDAIAAKRAAKARSPAAAQPVKSAGLPPRPADAAARLSDYQQALWTARRLAPESAAYHLVSAFRLSGEIDLDRLESAIAAAVSRHRILHSTFRAEGDSAIQVIGRPDPALKLQRVAAESGTAIEVAQREARRPLDLEHAPVIRALLVDDGADRILALVMHHLLADERSLATLWDEIANDYCAQPVNPPPVQFDDYVHWDRTREEPARAADREYWSRRLDPKPQPLALPFARSADPASSRGKLIKRSVEGSLAAAVRRLAAKSKATPFNVYAFAFRLLLQRASGEDAWAFGTPVSKRSHPDAAQMIGYFLNAAAITAVADETRPVQEAIGAFAQDLRESIAHASPPLEQLTRDAGSASLFQTMFVHQLAPAPVVLDGARLEPVQLDLGESKFDLTLFVSEGEDALELAVEYRTDRFDQVWMERLLDRYQALLESLAAAPEAVAGSVSELPGYEAEELRTWSQGEPLAASDQPLAPQQIRRQAESAAERPAVIGAEQTWTYAQLARRASRIAAELQTCGIGRGDRVGLFIDRSPEMIAGLVGALWSGAAYVPLDPTYPSERIAATLEDAEAKAVATTQALASRLPSGSYRPVQVDALTGDYGDFQPPDPSPDDPAYLLYTSGSTGRPKGVIVTHANLRASNAARLQYYSRSPERFLLLSSVAFDSSVAGIFWALTSGGALVLPSDDEARDPKALAKRIERDRVDALLCVPSLYSHLLAETGADLSALRTAVVAGESCPTSLVAEHFQVLPDAKLFNEYGPTEASVWATVDEFRPDGAEPRVTIGRPIPGVAVEVLDELGRPTPPGIPGEGWISGPTVAQGYWRRPDLTAERFVPRGEAMAYRTGDRLAWGVDGRLQFLGRVDNQIKLRGFRIEPEEIEAVLTEQPGVEEAVVVVQSGPTGEQLIAFLRTDAAVEDLHAPLTDRLAERLPAHMVPARFVPLDGFPRLPNGKADRKRLAAAELAPEAPVRRDREFLSERQQALVSLWEGLLGRTGVRSTDNFFRIGGHSLLMISMAAALRRDFGAEISPAELFQHPTIADLDRLIENRATSSAPAYRHLFPIQPSGDRPPLIFAIPHFFADLFSQRFRGERPVYGLRGVGIRPGGNRGLWPTMEKLGEELVDEVLDRFPPDDFPDEFVVAGYSFGASMAFELARLLEQRSARVHGLYLISPMPLDFYRLGPLKLQLEGLRKPLEELSAAEATALLARGARPWAPTPYARLRRLLVTRPKRQLQVWQGDLRKKRGQDLTPDILHADVRVERFRLHAQYRPGVIETPTVIFNGEEPAVDSAATWRSHFRGDLQVVPIPDPHLGDDKIAGARERIRQYLEQESDW